MRNLTCIIQQNTGNGLTGNSQNISATITSISPITQCIDDDLTKIQQSSISVTVADPTDGIWNFIQSSLALAGGVYPPYLIVMAGSTQLFLGLIRTDQIERTQTSSERTVSFTAQDWTIQLAQTYLGSPTALPWASGTAYANGNQVYNAGSVYQCVLAGTSSTTSAGPSGIGALIQSGLGNGSIAIQDGTCVWIYIPPAWQRPTPTIASNPGLITNRGYSYNYGGYNPGYSEIIWGLTWGNSLNSIYFPDPCGFAYPGATMKMDYPVFYADLTLPNVVNSQYVMNDGYGGTVTEGAIYVGGNIRNCWSWVSPKVVTDLHLPSVQFPPLTYVASMTDGIQYQVSANGLSWVLVPTPYSTTLSTAAWTICNTQDIQPCPLSELVYQSNGLLETYLNTTCTTSPWPTPYNSSVSGIASLCPGSWTANFTMANLTQANIDYWAVMAPVTNGYSICLNSVNGIFVGDKIGIVNSNTSDSWTVAGVDATLNLVNTIEEVSSLNTGTQIYWTDDSIADMVLQDPVTILKATLPYNTLDTSRFTPSTTTDYLFSWLPLYQNAQAPIFAIGDIETTRTAIKLSQGACWINPTTGSYQPSYSWVGEPGAWGSANVASPTIPYNDWTSQLLSAPTSQMPYEPLISIGSANGVAPWIRLRNRAYADITYRRENNGLVWLVTNGTGRNVPATFVSVNVPAPNATPIYTYVENGNTYTSSNSNDNFSVWSSTGANITGIFPVYDYSQMKRYLFNTSAQANNSNVSIQAWSGSAWGTASNWNWPGGSYIQSAVPFLPNPGFILGYATTASISGQVNNSTWYGASTQSDRLELVNAAGVLQASISTINLPPALLGGTLVTTPYGIYLVGGSAIGQITYSGGILSITTLYMVDSVSFLFANTLTAIDANNFLIFGRYDTPGDNSTTETWLFRIQTQLTNSLDQSVIWDEKVSEGCPSLIGAVRDPAMPGRVVGHLGGSVWQVSKQRALGIDRFTPGGVTGIELIEHIAQYFSAVAIPDAYGVLHFISRTNTDVPINLNVLQCEIVSTYNWPNFYSIIQVNSADSNFNQYIYGQYGGTKLELDSHPLVWSDSAALATAESLVQWFGKPRQVQKQKWTYPDPNTAPPWEGILPFSLITVNGGTTQYRLMSIEYDVIAGTASVILVTN